MSSSEPELCAYCDSQAKTRDHIPPKTVFGRPLPNDMLTVPACLECNAKFSKEDEYIGNAILMRADIANHPGAQGAIDKAMRALDRVEAGGLSRSLLSTVRDAEIATTSGVILGNAPVFVVDNQRLAGFVCHVVRGLFHLEFGRRVPDEFRVGASLTIDRNPKNFASYAAFLSGQPIVTACGGSFAYAWREASDSPMSSVWVISLYNRVFYAGIVVNSKAPGAELVAILA